MLKCVYDHLITAIQKSKKSKKKWFGKGKITIPDSSPSETVTLPTHFSPPEEVKWTEVETEQAEYEDSSEDEIAAEGTVAEPQADEEVVQLTSVTQLTGIAREEASAIKIQKAFRGFQVYVSFCLNEARISCSSCFSFSYCSCFVRFHFLTNKRSQASVVLIACICF